MLKRCLIVVVAALLVMGFALTGLSGAENMKAKMDKADALYLQRADLEKARASIVVYEEVLAQEPENTEALWKAARVYYWLGTHSPKKERAAIFKKGIEYTEKAVSINDSCVPCHYWLGISYSVYGEAKGILKSLNLLDPVKAEMNKVNELDPAYDQGGAYRVLGRIAFKLPRIVGGSKKRSVEYLKKSQEYGPDNFLTHVFLAETYLGMKKNDLAKKELEAVLNAPDPKDPGELEDKKAARELYDKHFQ
ncbi:MAG: hypothetical protein JRG97_07145 [Deltaproteobacteria bacterium]|nr:hypothetical protein [Deltaproteobacteria bacterium]MBW2052267.1 hypothetical protein [Deltaproteobacteria bacterium]MBW2140833.1 hypothetical protein [Deltaproteobacteria bacterium]MBW2323644.1 hypothetical protein [Deltaproteobacteria bacterium]